MNLQVSRESSGVITAMGLAVRHWRRGGGVAMVLGLLLGMFHSMPGLSPLHVPGPSSTLHPRQLQAKLSPDTAQWPHEGKGARGGETVVWVVPLGIMKKV